MCKARLHGPRAMLLKRKGPREAHSIQQSVMAHTMRHEHLPSHTRRGNLPSTRTSPSCTFKTQLSQPAVAAHLCHRLLDENCRVHENPRYCFVVSACVRSGARVTPCACASAHVLVEMSYTAARPTTVLAVMASRQANEAVAHATLPLLDTRHSSICPPSIRWRTPLSQ